MTINNVEWRIEYVEPNNPVFLLKNGTYTIGVTDVLNHTISIANNLKGNLYKKVCIHEIAHAFMFSYDIYIDLSLEEWICNFIAEYGEDIIDKFYEFFEIIKRVA